MVSKAKNNEIGAALLLSVALVVCHITDAAPGKVGVFIGCSWWQHLTYQFFHAGILHLFINIWCILSIIVCYRAYMYEMILAYIISALLPGFLLSDLPTIGLSGMVLALAGLVSADVRNMKLYYGFMAVFLVIGFFFSHCIALLHLWSFSIGTMNAYYIKGVLRLRISKHQPCRGASWSDRLNCKPQ